MCLFVSFQNDHISERYKKPQKLYRSSSSVDPFSDSAPPDDSDDSDDSDP